MRDLIVFGLVVLSLPLAFRRPFFGLLIFSWLAYMRPQDLCWGFARTMRLSFFVGLAMVGGWFANEFGRRPFMRRDIRTTLMVALAITTTISLTQAMIIDKYVFNGYVEFVKIVIVALFTTGQVDTKARLRMLFWTIALCLGFFGFKGGLFGLLTGGAVIHRGPGGMLEDNNDFALALVMNIPLLFYLGRTEQNQLIKRFTDVTLLFTVITILLTHSRGGFLSLTLVSLVIAWRSGKLIQAALGLGLCAFAFFTFAPDHVIERIASIQSGGDETSAGARLRAWSIAMRMIEDNWFIGVGFRNFRDNYFLYGEEGWLEAGVVNTVAHNSYLQIWAEGGSLSFGIYLVLLASVWFACRTVRSLSRHRPDLAWAHAYGRMIEATTAGFMVGAFFLNRGHFDLFYHWLALLTALVYVVRVEAAKSPTKVDVTVADRGEIRARWRPAVLGPSRLPRWGRGP